MNDTTVIRQSNRLWYSSIVYRCILCILILYAITFTEPVKLIFDTDFGGDVDDAGALAMIHALADMGEAELLAVAVWNHAENAVEGIDVINTYYGRGDIPIGRRPGPIWFDSTSHANALTDLPHDQTLQSAPPVSELYRWVLAAQPDSSVTIVAVGPLANLQQLFATSPDQISPLSGIELVARKVERMVIMGGKYPDGGYEWNFNGGMQGVTREVLQKSPVPMIFSGYEIGSAIKTGGKLKTTPPENPVRISYEAFNTNCPAWYTPCPGTLQGSPSYDQTAVLYAVRGARNYWELSEKGLNVVEEDGTNKWVSNPQKQQTYLVEKMSPKKMEEVIESLMIRTPKKSLGSPAE